MEVRVDDRDVVRVLLVGDSLQSFSLSRQLLEERCCEWHFAGSLEEAKDLLDLLQFDIVLSMQASPGETVQKLVGLLSGSGASLYAALRVEMGFWWLPVLQFGKESYGPALRVDEFRQVLDDLREQAKVHGYASQRLADPKPVEHSRFPNS
jgi:hypothetical protein